MAPFHLERVERDEQWARGENIRRKTTTTRREEQNGKFKTRKKPCKHRDSLQELFQNSATNQRMEEIHFESSNQAHKPQRFNLDREHVVLALVQDHYWIR